MNKPALLSSRDVIRTEAWMAGWADGSAATGINMFFNETEPSSGDTNPSTPFGTNSVICLDACAMGTAVDWLSQGMVTLLWSVASTTKSVAWVSKYAVIDSMGSLWTALIFLTSIPSLATSDLRLFGGKSPQRSSVDRTPGNSIHSVSCSGETCKMVSPALAMSAAVSACANAVSLAWLKSEG